MKVYKLKSTGGRKHTSLKQFVAILLIIVSHNVATAEAKDVLDGLIEQSIQTYPAIKSKEMTRESAKQDVVTASLNFLPNATVNFQSRRRVYGDSSSKSTIGDPYTVITISQPLIGGGLVAGYRQSKANLNASDWALREEAENIAIRVINAYGAWLSAHKKLSVSEDSVKEYERLVSLITHRAEAGVSPLTDQNLGVSRLLQAQSELSSYRAKESSALTTLSQLVGQRLTREQLLSQQPENNFAMPEDVVMKVLEVSPTLKRLQFEAESANQASKKVRSQAFPQLSLQARRTIGDPDYQNTPPKNTVGLVLSYSTDSGFSSFSKILSADKAYYATVLNIDSAKRDVVVRVNQEVSDYQFAKSREKPLQKYADLTKAISESYSRLFLVGKKSWLDLMNSVRERKEAQVELVDVQVLLLTTSRRLSIYTQNVGFDSVKQ
ncbi:TolC family protein [Formosimonas limnophila]|uniref:TolC family protein n=1 Tax=Formosimonas limnophila TaxID=1384487 RepID=UPI001678D552|nr:TolC family protein [Formosimonas limnophila]